MLNGNAGPLKARKIGSIKDCARCGGSHESLVAKEFHYPFRDMTHWATCPNSGDPILVKFVDTPDAAVEDKPPC